jgi:phospholipid/cholesterol/gamma-HCH transport system substrate-binding protein
MENKSHAYAAGTFVLALLALLIGLAFWLTQDNTQQRVFELSSREAVTGLQPQASVRFKGVNVGKVTAIGFDALKPGNVLIRIAINEQAPVTTSTFATLGFQGVTGLAFVQLDDSGESKTTLAAHSTPPARIPLRPGLMTKLTDQGEEILSQLLDATRQFNQLLSPENQKIIMGTVSNLDLAATRFGELASNADALLATQLDPQRVSIPKLVQEASAAFATLGLVSKRVGDSADEARASARAFRTVTERMSAPGGTLDQLTAGANTLAATGQTLNAATLPRLNQAVEAAAGTARQLTRTLTTVNENPQALLLGNTPVPPGPGEAGFSESNKPP